jgi:hypothetical protein
MAGVAASDWSWSCLIEDFDLDGQPDIFIANGIERRPNSLDYLNFISSDLSLQAGNLEAIYNMPPGQVANQVFWKTGEWIFEEVGKDWGLDYIGASTGAAVADFDQDGDLDLVINNLNAAAIIYENKAERSGEDAARAYEFLSLCPQRGMLSQSEGPYRQPAAAEVKASSRFSVKPSGIVRKGGDGNYFDAEPLAPYQPTKNDYPVLRFEGGIALRIGSGMQFASYLWDGDSLVLADTMALPALRNTRTLELPSKPLALEFPMVQQTLFAEAYSPLRLWLGGERYLDLQTPSGWWQSLNLIDGDGGPGTNIIAGNWGLNSALGSPDPASPIRLYEVDVDGNGQVDPLLTYIRGGKEITVADKDELQRQIPGLKRNNLSYTDFARRTFRELFPALEVEASEAQSFHHIQIKRLNGGNWQLDTLPRATQITTLNAVLEIPEGLLLGGNKREVLPRIGRQDAAALQLLKPDGSIEFIDLSGGNNRLEIRHLVLLDQNHALIVVSEGNHLLLSW